MVPQLRAMCPTSLVAQRHAMSTYNFLSEEGRRVAAALLPIHDYTPHPPLPTLPRRPEDPSAHLSTDHFIRKISG